MELESSVTMETQLKIAPDTIPLDIIGTVIRLNVRYMQQPSWLQSAPPHNVHSVHLLFEKKCHDFRIDESSRLFHDDGSEDEQNTYYFAKADSHQEGG